MGMRRVINYRVRNRTKTLGDEYEIGIVVERCCRMQPAIGRAGVGAGRQDRHFERSVRRLCGLRRQVVVRSRENGGGGFRRRGGPGKKRKEFRRPPKKTPTPQPPPAPL